MPTPPLPASLAAPRLLAGALLALWLLATAAHAGMGIDDARHLLARAGFGADAATVRAFAAKDRAAAIEDLLTRRDPPLPLPDWGDAPLHRGQRVKDLPEEERRRVMQAARERGQALKGWWLRQMSVTEDPLRERMTLFWHKHFTSSLQKVKAPQLLARQNALLREHALGKLRTLTQAIARDPAMLIYLDGRQSRRDAPNENFARELLELFTLGEGHYTETDIKEAARAFTGWGVDLRSGEARFRPRQHDGGEKRFLGQRGRFDADAIIDIVFAQPAAARFIVAKLWREFISAEPDPDEVERLARVLRSRDYALTPLLRALFNSDAFWDPAQRGVLIKSPVDLVVGLAREFDFTLEDGRLAARATRSMGQDLFDPPNVRGWPGGADWITSDSLLQRRSVLERLLRGEQGRRPGARENKKGKEPPQGTAMTAPMGERITRFVASLNDAHHSDGLRAEQVLLPLPPHEAQRNGDAEDFVRALLADPVYQLK